MPLRYIFQLSDLHIRNGDASYCRFNEYNAVFKNTIISIANTINNRKLKFDDFVIIITGDIFHNKNNIGNHGLLLYKTFVQELTKIGRLIIFSGNHDKMQSNQEQPTLVYSSSFDIHNLTILNHTHSFVIDDIGFSYVDINDTLDTFKNSGRIQDLPPFPLFDESTNIKCKIALFHGSFAAVKLYNGENVRDDTNPYPLEWIKDFDYVLLGDIHKRQVFNYKKRSICGYSGSLIQQNFGEDIIDHGYLLWDLWDIENKIPEEFNVYNNIGYINIIEDASQIIFIRTNGKYTESLEEYIKNNIRYFPKIIEIKSFSYINFENLNNLLKSFNISFQIVSKLSILNHKDIDINDAHPKKDIRIDNMIDTNYLLDYFKKLLTPDKYKILNKIIKNKEYLLFDINKYPEELSVECTKKNKELYPIINSCNNVDDVVHNKKSFLIKYLEWEGLLCYENKCWINFNDLNAKTFMIKGSNGTGKSAIYDILVLAIWAANNKLDTYSAGFINHNKEKAYTIIDIEIDNIIYRIKRDFCKKKNTFKLNNKGSVLSKFVNCTDLIVLKKDTACNTEVKLLFGDIDTFLSTSMITQNVDNDILSLNYKDTLETIDKANNIQYIYNLYNLFKTAINKYKDLRKVINSKKEVYEKLLFNDVNQHVNDDVISQLTEELSLSNACKNELLKTYNSINIDINNPLYLSIIETDYQSLLDDIHANKNNIIVSEDIYAIYTDKLNHLKYSLNDDFKDLQTLAKSYSQQLEDDFGKLPFINKPCDISFLCNEEKSLMSYNDNDNDNDNDEEQLIKYKEELIKNKQVLNNLISNKPAKVSTQLPSDRKIDNVIDDITSIYGTYGSIDVLNNFISSNIKPHVVDTDILKELRETINEPITYLHYNTVIQRKEVVVGDICNIKNNIISLEINLNLQLLKQQKITIKNTPPDIITYKRFKTSVSIAKELKNYNIDIVDVQIADDEIIMKDYNKKIEEINKLDVEIDNYNKELHVFSSNDEYKYNPECCICCNRPWVSRIKEIEIIINSLNINKRSLCYSKQDFDTVSGRLEENKTTRANYHLLNAWYDYYKFKEAYDKIAKEINHIINTKNTLNNELENKALYLKNIENYTNYFNIYSFQLFEELSAIQSYDIYSAWENNYNDTKSVIEELEKRIHYNEVVKPRITKYRELKNSYENWLMQEHNKKIIDAFHYNKLKNIIDVNDLYNEYHNNERMKPLIKQKIELRNLLANKNSDIKTLHDKIIKYTTINSYNDDNKSKYVVLTSIDTELETIIDVLDTILCNFQSFRKELYESFILNKLVDKTNKIIKTLCHSNTKPFKLNYNVDISNDNVHINWLIHNDNISNKDEKDDKQYISVSQASGFQHFVISLALRMSLYLNNYDVLCNQLFIDEGFINFDKYNLSIVPSFLKSLLHYFNTIVILSHIDIIQDSVDETANICFNHKNGRSSITYN